VQKTFAKICAGQLSLTNELDSNETKGLFAWLKLFLDSLVGGVPSKPSPPQWMDGWMDGWMDRWMEWMNG